MVCPYCGTSTNASGVCGTCGGAGQTYAVTGVLSLDTTGLPPGATRSPGVPNAGLATGESAPLDTSSETSLPTGASAISAEAPRPARKGPLHVGQSFGPRYHIIKLLGAGGMGAVYQAWDAELGVAVALKVIRQDASDRAISSEAEKRFKNELLLARQVTHKNVVRIHDLGELDGIKYITMPYIKGDDLASTLKRDGKLPRALALRIGRQIAAGLEAAHDAGVVHRDLKPANVMISRHQDEVHAQIMDFGISVSTEEAMSGGLIGTLEYMAPEQGAGLAVDARADIYAFGLILYEMLSGPRQSGGRTPQQRFESMQQRCRDGLPAVRTLDASIPGALEGVVMRCLERDPAARFQNTHELVAALARLDDDGELIPEVRKLTPRMMIAAAVIVSVLLGGTYYVAERVNRVEAAHEPVSVVIADFDNRTGDPAFDRTLEPMLRRALEGASFITAYDHNGIRGLGVQPPDRFDANAARLAATNQGLGIVLAGFIERDGGGYRISMNAVQTVDGKTMATERATARSKDQVLAVATNLVANVRSALGDSTTSESQQLFAMQKLSATSLDVVRHYAAAQDAATSNRFEDARSEALKAVEIDPKFGIGYQLVAVASRNLGDLQGAVKYGRESTRYVDNMTEREKYSVRGFYYRLTGDYQKCVDEYSQLIKLYSADPVGHNQLALCMSQLRNMKGALDEMRKVVAILPRRMIFRDNLALYANYAGDFQAAQREVAAMREPDAYASLALAFSQLGQGSYSSVVATYEHLATLGSLGSSFANSGLGDLAAVEGRFGEAVTILRSGAEKELADGKPDLAAAKLLAVSYAELSRGDKRAAVAAAREALSYSQAVKVRFIAARTFIEAGNLLEARPIVNDLGLELQAEPQAYAKILEGNIALSTADPRQAIKLLDEAGKLLDTWIGHFDLGRAYLAAKLYTQADSEFDRCLTRRGEALALFLDEEPTYAYLPPVYYYQGLVREGMGTEKFTESYRTYLSIRGNSTEDPLLREVRRRVGG